MWAGLYVRKQNCNLVANEEKKNFRKWKMEWTEGKTSDKLSKTL